MAPIFHRSLAPHVQRALGVAQAKEAPPSPFGPAPHVRAAIATVHRGSAAPVSPPSPAVQRSKLTQSVSLQLPVLTAVLDVNQNQEGYCGNFQRVRTWKVQNPVPGVIIQEVTRQFNVSQVNGNALSGSALDNYVQDPNSSVHAGDTKYWELWAVDSKGKVSDGGDDTFGLCSIIPWNGIGIRKYQTHVAKTTKGTFIMSGTAYFYPTSQTPTQLGFTQGAVACAGGLYSRKITPSGLPSQSCGPVTYKVTVTWNSNANKTVYSKVQ